MPSPIGYSAGVVSPNVAISTSVPRSMAIDMAFLNSRLLNGALVVLSWRFVPASGGSQ